MKGFIFLLLIVVVGYILGLFLAPDIVKPIGDSLGLKSVNETIVNKKGELDKLSTGDLSVENIQKKYSETIDTAMETKKQIENGIINTKDQIDDFRAGVNETRETIESGVKTFNETKEQIEKTSKQIQEGAKQVQEFTDTVNNITK